MESKVVTLHMVGLVVSVDIIKSGVHPVCTQCNQGFPQCHTTACMHALSVGMWWTLMAVHVRVCHATTGGVQLGNADQASRW
jgi:hypothetical protein